MDKIYLLHAAAQSGKNTCAEMMKEYYKATYKKRVCIIAFADYVKFVLDKYYDIPFERTEEYRTHIQHFATDQCRTIDEDVWVEIVHSFINVVKDDFDIFIIPDWRFENECVRLEANYYRSSIVKVCIRRPGVEENDGMTDEQRAHESERNLDKFKRFDYNIINETGNMQKTIQQLVDMIDEVERNK